MLLRAVLKQSDGGLSGSAVCTWKDACHCGELACGTVAKPSMDVHFGPYYHACLCTGVLHLMPIRTATSWPVKTKCADDAGRAVRLHADRPLLSRSLLMHGDSAATVTKRNHLQGRPGQARYSNSASLACMGTGRSGGWARTPPVQSREPWLLASEGQDLTQEPQ